jgi:hypothetical protein
MLSAMNKPRAYFSYLLRLWRSDEATPWRASLEDARTHEQHAFPETDLLFAFLREQMQADANHAELDESQNDQNGGKP